MPKIGLSAGYLHFFGRVSQGICKRDLFFPLKGFLVEKMIEPVPLDYRGRVVELASGNGTLTVCPATKRPNPRVLACEIDPVLAEDTRKNLLRAGVNGQVQVRATLAVKAVHRNGSVASFRSTSYPRPFFNLTKRRV